MNFEDEAIEISQIDAKNLEKPFLGIRFLPVCLSPEGNVAALESTIHEANARNWRLFVVFAECSPCSFDDFIWLHKQHVLFMIDGESLLGRNGIFKQRLAMNMILHGCVNYVEFHSGVSRLVRGKCRRLLNWSIGRIRADILMSENANLLYCGRPPEQCFPARPPSSLMKLWCTMCGVVAARFK